MCVCVCVCVCVCIFIYLFIFEWDSSGKKLQSASNPQISTRTSAIKAIKAKVLSPLNYIPLVIVWWRKVLQRVALGDGGWAAMI